MLYIKQFKHISMTDVALFGGKNASLGEMIQHLSQVGIKVPDGFAISTKAYFEHIKTYNIDHIIKKTLEHVETFSQEDLKHASKTIRKSIEEKPFKKELVEEIIENYHKLSREYKTEMCAVAVRSSASSEDSPTASFAGQQESFVGIKGEKELIEACKKCMSSLFTERAILYRTEKGFDHLTIGISVGIQKMIRSDTGSSGVGFSLDPESGFTSVITIESTFGLGEAIVQGLVIPDLFVIHKTLLQKSVDPIIKKQKGEKKSKLIFKDSTVKDVETNKERNIFSIKDQEVIQLAKMIAIIEDHYSEINKKYTPMDIEWAKDGFDHQLYIIQARPETVHTGKKKSIIKQYILHKKNEKPILQGQSIGTMIASGKVRKIKSIESAKITQKDEIIVTTMTSPDLMPFLKHARGIITEKGGRTCHAAIVSRELHIPAIVGVKNALSSLNDGEIITIDCSEGTDGFIYQGEIPFNIEEYSIANNNKIPVPIMLNIADPDAAFSVAQLPVSGIGLTRIEFIIANRIKIHPMATITYDTLPQKIKHEIQQIIENNQSPKDFYIETLARSLSEIVASFYPKDVIVRFSDFKTNEYCALIGGDIFEPKEDNPMLGFRGAMRYIDPEFIESFYLECASIRYLIEQMQLTNITLLIPFVRTVREAKKVIEILKQEKLGDIKRSMMVELPANLFDLEQYASLFHGFSIGSNDLFQMTFGSDRDSEKLAEYIDEREPSFLELCKLFIEKAKKYKSEIGICGQAPSDFPEVRDFLIKSGISYISLNADAILSFIEQYKK